MPKTASLTGESLSADVEKLFEILNESSDLSVLLIGASFLDACLLAALRRKLLSGSTTESLLDHNGALGSFVSRAKLCYSLGLMPKSFLKDICQIAKIRNKAAHHHLVMSFDDKEIIDLCEKLETVGNGVGANARGRDRYTVCVVLLSQLLLLRSGSMGKSEQVQPVKEPSFSLIDLTVRNNPSI